MIIKEYRPTVSDPHDLQNWIVKATSHIRTNRLKECRVHMTHKVRNELFVTLGVAGGESPILFGIPVILEKGNDLGCTLHLAK